MAKLKDIAAFLNKELKIRSIKDSSKNGLQVKCKSEVNEVGFAVDSCLSTFELAKKAKVDLLIVHHGLKWMPPKYKEINKIRTNFLKKNGISLYAAHLPLDAHYKYGNNIELCRVLDLAKTKKFGKYHGFELGYSGNFKKPKSLSEIKATLNKKLKTKCKVYDFGKKTIRSIGIVSGAGSDSIEEAVKTKKDCFLVGEIKLSAYHRGKDLNLSMIVAGHYATETLGVKTLMPIISKRFKVQTIFIDDPTGI